MTQDSAVVTRLKVTYAYSARRNKKAGSASTKSDSGALQTRKAVY